LYEGTLLPEKFRGQLIHAEPGHNVIRSYPVENDGAGYKASIINILEGQNDQWFRPADVTVAPDGSLFVADWYDPGVGGHQMGDPNRGRIYRIAPPKSLYQISKINLETPEGAVEALLNPNPATRYWGYYTLSSMKEKAVPALVKIWKDGNVRQRAQAFWLLIKLSDQPDNYIKQAILDKNADIRITGVRAVRAMKKDFLKFCALLLNDASPQVRRELAIALRDLRSPEAAQLWADLATQYDGKDRWYLEALGIGASGHWGLYFDAWLRKVNNDWNTPNGRDIVWRSRSKKAIPMLAELIQASNDSVMLRYFRSFDFHTDPSRQAVLAKLVGQTKGDKVLYALKHMDASQVKMTETIKSALNRVLEDKKGKIEFVELVTTFKLTDRSNELLQLGLNVPGSEVGKDAVKTLLDWKRIELISGVLQSRDNDKVAAMIKALSPHMHRLPVIELLQNFMLDTTRDVTLRKLAVKTFGGPWESEDRLLELAKKKKIPADLQIAASGVFQTVWRASLRDEAAKYLAMPGSKDGKPLAKISDLIDKDGVADKGKVVFATTCGNCHRVADEGTDFGPDLSEIGDKLSKEAMYSAILFPDQGISFGFEAWRLKLRDGSSVFGRIVSETEDKVDVQYMANKQTVLKSDISTRTKLESSLMPSNLQSNMTEQELVDLISYLKSLSKNNAL
jgi:putative heme-binding domain-containing protein